MAIIKTKVQQDLTSMVHVTPLKGLFFGGDVEGNMLGVYVTNKGQPVELEGNCRGYVILSDNSSFMVNGEIEDSTAWITLPAACYSKTGVISIAIKVGTVTLAAFCGVVHKTLTETIIDPDHVIPSIDELIEKIAQMEAVMEGAENVNAEVTKSGNVITISVTNRDGITHEYDISEMDPDKYARKDGYYSEMTVGNAEQLVSSKFVEDQEPYTLRASGGSADIGNRENLTAIVGGTLAWNQQVRDEASDNVTEFADIVTVDDAVADNAGVKVKIEPVQDLHGYDSPWPAGGGLQLIPYPYSDAMPVTKNGITFTDIGNGRIHIQGTATGIAYFNFYGKSSTPIPAWVKPNTQYTLRPITVSAKYFVQFILYGSTAYTVTGSTFTTPNDLSVYTGFAVVLGVYNGAEVNADISPMLEYGATAHDFVPYSNVCPISGWTAAKVTRTGKNLCDESKLLLANGWTENNGEYSGVNSALHFAFSNGFPGINFKANTICTVSFKFRASTASKLTVVGFKYTDGTQSAIYIQGTDDHTVSHTSTAGKSVSYLFFSYGSSDTVYIRQMQVEEGSTATDYEPYSGQTYSITLPSEAGTVYGGELTVNEDGAGSLKVTHGFKTFTGAEGYSFTTYSTETLYTNASILPGARAAQSIFGHCNMVTTASNGAIATAYIDKPSASSSGVEFKKVLSYWGLEAQTSAALNSKLAEWYANGTPLQIMYELATPATYTLTASQVTTLLGTNNVWSDAGQLSLTYTGTDEHLTLTDGRKYLTRINGTDSMVLGAGQALTAVKGRDNVFDLTQMFGAADVADYVYGQGAGYFRRWFPNSLYAYNPGELKSVEGLQSHDTVGFNLFDKSNVTHGHFVNGNDYSAANADWAHSDYIPVIGGMTYYYPITYVGVNSVLWYDSEKNMLGKRNGNALYSLPQEACYVRINMMEQEIDTACIHLVNSGSRNGEYEPHTKHSYPLDSTLTLRGIPKSGSNGIYWDGDQYKPDGTVERRYGVVDLGSLTWTYNSNWGGGGAFYCNVPPAGIKTDNPTAIIPNALCTWYEIYSRDYLNTHPNISGLCIPNNNAQISIRDSAYTDAASFKSAMSGVLLVYELAAPTTETADPYHELQQVDDWGTEEFVTTGIIPVGHVTQYPANLRDKLQHLPDLASSNGIYIVKQTDSEMELMRLPDMPTANGNYRLKLNVASGSPTFSWEVVT